MNVKIRFSKDQLVLILGAAHILCKSIEELFPNEQVIVEEIQQWEMLIRTAPYPVFGVPLESLAEANAQREDPENLLKNQQPEISLVPDDILQDWCNLLFHGSQYCWALLQNPQVDEGTKNAVNYIGEILGHSGQGWSIFHKNSSMKIGNENFDAETITQHVMAYWERCFGFLPLSEKATTI